MKKYLVGGCVRDTLLGRDAQDRDWVVVGSTEAEMFAAGFSRVGESFPVFLHPETGDEYALARTEKKTGVGYTGFETFFDKSVTLKEDLARRDLTINSIASNEDMTQFFDPFGGIKDLFQGVLRHTSDAFVDDPLRVVRLARFYARYVNFKIAPETVEMAKRVVDSGEMDHITDERYWEELVKVFADSANDANVERFFFALREFGVFNKVKYFAWYRKTSYPRPVAMKEISSKFGAEVSMAAFFALNGIKTFPAKCTNAVADMAQTLCEIFDAQYSNDTGDHFIVFKTTSSFHHRSELFNTALAVVDILDGDNETSEIFSKMFNSVSKVNAKMFPHLTGKELGYAINAKRVDRILKVLSTS